MYVRAMSVLRFVRLGGYSVRRWVGVCTRTLKVLPYQGHKPIQLVLWEQDPRALKCFAFASVDLFCVRAVWQDFIRVVVLCLLS